MVRLTSSLCPHSLFPVLRKPSLRNHGTTEPRGTNVSAILAWIVHENKHSLLFGSKVSQQIFVLCFLTRSYYTISISPVTSSNYKPCLHLLFRIWWNLRPIKIHILANVYSSGFLSSFTVKSALLLLPLGHVTAIYCELLAKMLQLHRVVIKSKAPFSFPKTCGSLQSIRY